MLVERLNDDIKTVSRICDNGNASNASGVFEMTAEKNKN